MKIAFWIWTISLGAGIAVAFIAIPGWDTDDAWITGAALFAVIATLIVVLWAGGIGAVAAFRFAGSLLSQAQESAAQSAATEPAASTTPSVVRVLREPRALLALVLLGGLFIGIPVAIGTWWSQSSRPLLYPYVKGGAGPFWEDRLRWAFNSEYGQLHRTVLREQRDLVPKELFQRCLEESTEALAELGSVEVLGVYDEPIRVATTPLLHEGRGVLGEEFAKAVVLRIAVREGGKTTVRTIERYAIPDQENGEGRWPLSASILETYRGGLCPGTEEVLLGEAAVQLRRPAELLKTGLQRMVRQQWGWAWETLHPAQQRFVKRERFDACQVGSTRHRAYGLRSFDVGETRFESIMIPGTGLRPRALAVPLRLEIQHRRPNGSTSIQATAYVVRLETRWRGRNGGWRGDWRWLLAPEDAAAYIAGTCPRYTSAFPLALAGFR